MVVITGLASLFGCPHDLISEIIKKKEGGQKQSEISGLKS
ncbi:hypothetical protein ADIS_0764 [Lunatimonas lonarensis]|uniref:Uncharacterized protein n=1 Tax=Lunatimonas lonarensis TaxID=1232681 RepID=R7ZXS1_9BACT|nr:hypothetical protein ADIS_0764 [Lunatimonas lonarensis]